MEKEKRIIKSLIDLFEQAGYAVMTKSDYANVLIEKYQEGYNVGCEEGYNKGYYEGEEEGYFKRKEKHEL